ncbi:MAG: hemopexin repeat-containing protein [Saprospiraceae bacterium]
MRAYYIFLCLLCLMFLNQQVKSQDSIPILQPVNLEMANPIDAAFYLEKENKDYFFSQMVYFRLFNNQVDSGYPTKIQNGWKNLPQYWNTGIDAALRCEPNKKTIFFKGREYFIIQNGHRVATVPKKLPGEFKNLPRYFHSNIDAAVYLTTNHRMYLFKGNQYVRIKNNKVEQGYPKKLPGEFKKLPKEYCSDIDAVLHRNGDTFFYKNGQYVKCRKITGFQKKLK